MFWARASRRSPEVKEASGSRDPWREDANEGLEVAGTGSGTVMSATCKAVFFTPITHRIRIIARSSLPTSSMGLGLRRCREAHWGVWWCKGGLSAGRHAAAC